MHPFPDPMLQGQIALAMSAFQPVFQIIFTLLACLAPLHKVPTLLLVQVELQNVQRAHQDALNR
jgi:hypothetical protein